MDESTKDQSTPPAATASSIMTGPWYDIETLDKILTIMATISGCIKPPMDGFNALGIASIASGESLRGIGSKTFAVADEVGAILKSATDLMPLGVSYPWFMKLLDVRHAIPEAKAYVHELENRLDSYDRGSGAAVDRTLRRIYKMCQLAAEDGNDTAIYALQTIRPLYKKTPHSPDERKHDDGTQTNQSNTTT
jgi:hypothetical protein